MKYSIGTLLILTSVAQAAVLTVTPTADAYVRSDGDANGDDDTYNDINELIVGRVQGNEWIRPIMEFDLSGIDDGATINSVTLTMTVSTRDTSSTSNPLGASGLQLFQMTTDADFTNKFTWNDQSWGGNQVNGGGDDTPWTTAGGDFSSTALATIASVPLTSVNPGDTFTFATGANFVNAISGNLGDDTLQLMLRTPSLEPSFNERKLIRFASESHSQTSYYPQLTIDYTPSPEPSSSAMFGLGVLMLAARRKRN